MKKSLSLLSASTALLLGLSAFQASAQEPQTPSADAPGITQDVHAPKAAETAEAPVTPVQEEAEKEAPAAADTTSEAAAPQTDDVPAAGTPVKTQEEAATPVETPQEEATTAPAETQEEAVAPVETQQEVAAPTAIEEAPASQPAKAVVQSPLTGTSWGLVRIESGDGAVLKPKFAKNFTITFVDDKTVAVRINCNNGKSSWAEKESLALELAPLAMTRKACPTASPIDERMFKDWEYVRHYIIEKGRLHMSLQADAGTYEFRPLKK